MHNMTNIMEEILERIIHIRNSNQFNNREDLCQLIIKTVVRERLIIKNSVLNLKINNLAMQINKNSNK